MKSTRMSNNCKNDSRLEETRNKTKKWEKIGDHGDDGIGGKMVVDSFGVTPSKSYVTLVAEDVLSSSPKHDAANVDIFVKKWESGKDMMCDTLYWQLQK